MAALSSEGPFLIDALASIAIAREMQGKDGEEKEGFIKVAQGLLGRVQEFDTSDLNDAQQVQAVKELALEILEKVISKTPVVELQVFNFPLATVIRGEDLALALAEILKKEFDSQGLDTKLQDLIRSVQGASDTFEESEIAAREKAVGIARFLKSITKDPSILDLERLLRPQGATKQPLENLLPVGLFMGAVFCAWAWSAYSSKVSA